MNRHTLLSLSLFGMLFVGMALFADEVWVTNATATPHWPWDGRVDITYSLEGDAAADEKFMVFFTGYDKVLQEEVPAMTLSGDGVEDKLPLGGPYSTTWDFGADYPKGHYSDMVVKVETMSQGESYALIVNGETRHVLPGDTVSVTAQEQPGKTFVGWTADGVELDSYLPKTLSFPMPAAEVTLTAKFVDTASLYMVVNLLTGEVRYSATAPDLKNDTCRTTELWLRKIPAGTFSMGSPDDEIGRDASEIQHRVTLTDDYYIGVFEITQRQYELITSEKPSYFSNASCYATRPVENVSYDTIRGTEAGAIWPASHAVDGTSFLGILRNKTGLIFDLPTEAQMEYACRAGTTTSLNTGKNIVNQTTPDANLNEAGRNWYNGGSNYSQTCDTSAGTAKVGSYLPNAWGLYDMHGNVWEWCLDWYGPYSGDAVDPVGAQSGSRRVVRGGGCFHYPQVYRSASRGNYFPDYDYYFYGFRVVCLPYHTVSVNGEPLVMKDGETVSVTAAVKPGKTFVNWTVAGMTVDDATANPLEFSMPANNVTLFANYDGGQESATYLVVYLEDDAAAGIKAGDFQYTNTAPDPRTDDACRTSELWLKRIPAGSFNMGSPSDEVGRKGNETLHQVTLTDDYYIGIFEMTQRQYELVTGERPSLFNNNLYYATRPVEYVSYNMIRGSSQGAGWPSSSNVDGDSFMGRLRSMTGLVFDLPTEAQWEYACRAGTATSLNTGTNVVNPTDSDANLNEAGRNWFNGGSAYSQNCDPSAGTAKVGSYQPNAWGLYDMHGNVWEWCLDWYSNSDYSAASATDPEGAQSGKYRMMRGGGWSSKKPELFRSAYRFIDRVPDNTANFSGFRVVFLP